jgi:hypothetical protein
VGEETTAEKLVVFDRFTEKGRGGNGRLEGLPGQ